MVAYIEAGVGHHDAADQRGKGRLAIQRMRAVNDQARVDRPLAGVFGIEGRYSFVRAGFAAPHPPFDTTPAHVAAGYTSTVPAMAKGCMNSRTRASSFDSTIMYIVCSPRTIASP